MIRLFVAIDFPKETKQEFADLVDSLIEDGYPLVFEKEENFHLTLKFLGWCQEKRLSEIKETIKKAIAEIKPFWFRPTQIGYFLRESLILWVGVEAPAFVETTAGKQEGLVKLVNQLEKELSKIGFEKEEREFAAHTTLAKKRRATPFKKWERIAEEAKNKFHPEFSEFKVDRIVLMESTLTSQGSIYTLLSTFPLALKKFSNHEQNSLINTSNFLRQRSLSKR